MIAKFINHLKKAERGQSIIILAFAFVVLLGFVGLTTDVSLMFVRYATIRRAVDSASLAAATQMRQGTEEAAVQIAAKQFVEFHGLDSVEVLVETCQTLNQITGDPVEQEFFKEKIAELCTADQRKLVKVTVQAESPTAFLKLLGWNSFTLQASAISETAALDVVLIMDVSESMLTETTYDDWAKVGMGWIYEPPHIAGQVYEDKFAAGTYSGSSSDYWQDEVLRATGGQSAVNARLVYNFNSFSAPFDTSVSGTQDADYEVTVAALDGDALYNGSEFPSNASEHVPRRACRVRFVPSAFLEGPADKNGREDRNSDDFVDLDTLYNEFSISWNPPASYNDKWNGFVPTYDYYGCCNDPGTHKTDIDGLPIDQDDNGYNDLKNGDADFDFTDLICQPFKGARDAVELFLEKIDFIRGDRVAFVTFDRSAFLINPWNEEGQTTGGSHMIDRYDYALNTLRRVIGVRAEPNFYVWDDTLGSDPVINAGWGALGAGIERVGGVATSVAINYDKDDGSGDLYGHDPLVGDGAYGATERIQHSYPVYNNCYFADGALPAPYSLNGGTLGAISHPYTAGVAQDDLTAQSWGNYRISDTFGGGLRFDGIPDWFKARIGYEYYAECRGTNIGAALREGNNALLDPNTSRRFGAIWVMVLLSDGAAGASDPVRRDLNLVDDRGGEKLDTADPYVVDAFGVFNPFQGEYGAFGVCPYGSPGFPAELVDVKPEMDASGSPKFPYCSDEEPPSRHQCDFRPVAGEAAMQDFDYNDAPTNASGTLITDPTEIIQWNQDRGNLYDVDIGTTDCTYYDVDDYARDWADFIALRDENAITEELLPTIYTIGFGLTFGGEADVATARANYVGDYLGEQMLRYIADVGDNNQLDNDYYQDYAEEGSVSELKLNNGDFGLRGPCQELGAPFEPDINGEYDTAANMYEPLAHRDNCGNYFNAPNADELEFVFDSIASKLFTRLTG